MYLRARLEVVERRVRRTLAARRADNPRADADPYRGWYVAEQTVARLLSRSESKPGPGGGELEAAIEAGLAAAEAIAMAMEATGLRVRLKDLRKAFPISELDIELLVIALAPEIDPRFGFFYGYLHDDVSRSRASAGLALELCGTTSFAPLDRARLTAGAPLLGCGLLSVTDAGQPFPARTLVAADRVTGHLLGDDRIDPLLAGFARYLGSPPAPGGPLATDAVDRLAAGLASGAAQGRLVYLRAATDSAATDVATAAAARAADIRGGSGTVLADLTRLPPAEDAQAVLAAAIREAGLRQCGLVAGPVDRLPPDPAERARLFRCFEALTAPAVLIGSGGWDARWSDRPPLLAVLDAPGHGERDCWWQAALEGQPGGSAALSAYRLAPHQMRHTVEAARVQAAAESRTVTTSDLLRSARRHNAADLERLARRIEPSARWEDLVLAPPQAEQVRELAGRHRDRDRVLGDWRLRPAHGSAGGVAALFTGDSGTGKTLAAEVLATSAGIDLYVVNIATVVDKYVGETEKNLERIFTAAAGVQGMLFFDEADALFGRRAKVTDARDRFANIEVAYLLQRLETFDGLAILATNLPGNVDQAFLRRLDAIIAFPRPGVAERTRLWDLCLGPSVPRAAGLAVEPVAAAFDLTGGSIRSCALTAAYRAARTGRPVGTADLYAAVRHEYRKLGRVINEAEFDGTGSAGPGSAGREDVVAGGVGAGSVLD